MKKFEVSIEGKDVVLRSSSGEVESIRLNGGASFNLVRDNKLVLKIESPMIGENGLPTHEKEGSPEDSREGARQFVIASWIIANDGCNTNGHHIDCYGDGLRFEGIRCPLNNGPNTTCDPSLRVKLAEEWIEKYCQRKVETAQNQEQAVKSGLKKIGTKKITAMKDGRFLVDSEIVRSGAIIRMESPGDFVVLELHNEKTEAEVAKKQEQKAKQELKKICGACRYTPKDIVDFNQIVPCRKKGNMVPASFYGCSDFESRISEKSAPESGADTEGKKEMQSEAGCRWVFRPSATLPTDVSASDVICAFMSSDWPSKPSACVATPNLERIAQPEKENAELQSTNSHLRKELTWQFEQLTKKIGTLQDQNDRLRGEIDAAKRAENDSRCCWNNEHERTQQRIKELEGKLAVESAINLRLLRFL